MPLPIPVGASTLLVRRRPYEKAGLVRTALDERLGLAPNEFRVEGDLIAVGPVYNAEALASLVDDLERLGLIYYDDFFELSGNWPEWLSVLAASYTAPRRSNPSQPQP